MLVMAVQMTHARRRTTRRRPGCSSRPDEVVASVGRKLFVVVSLAATFECIRNAEPNLERVAAVAEDERGHEGGGPEGGRDIADDPRVVERRLEVGPEVEGILLLRLQVAHLRVDRAVCRDRGVHLATCEGGHARKGRRGLKHRAASALVDGHACVRHRGGRLDLEAIGRSEVGGDLVRDVPEHLVDKAAGRRDVADAVDRCDAVVHAGDIASHAGGDDRVVKREDGAGAFDGDGGELKHRLRVLDELLDAVLRRVVGVLREDHDDGQDEPAAQECGPHDRGDAHHALGELVGELYLAVCKLRAIQTLERRLRLLACQALALAVAPRHQLPRGVLVCLGVGLDPHHRRAVLLEVQVARQHILGALAVRLAEVRVEPRRLQLVVV